LLDPGCCPKPANRRSSTGGFFVRAKKITETEILNWVYNAADYETPMSAYCNRAVAPDKFVLPVASGS
jgi:hypothetical protein